MGEADKKTARPYFFGTTQKERDGIENGESGHGVVRASGKRGIRSVGRSPLYGAFDALRHGGGAGANPPGTEGAAHGRAAPKAASCDKVDYLIWQAERGSV